MGQTRIAVYDLNAAYTERFCRYMSERFGEKIEFIPVYEKSRLEEIISSRAVEAVLVPEKWKEGYPPFIGDIHVGYLTDKRTGEPGDIFRFQNLRALYGDIETLMGKQDTTVKMVSFIGTNAGVGTSAAAAAYAQRLASEEKKVLYINMNALGDITSVFQGGNQKDLQFLLDTINSGGDVDTTMAAVLNRDLSGVYFYDNADAPLGLMDITKEQMSGFLQKIKDSGEFRYIVIDSSFSTNRGLFAALDLSDQIIAVNDGTYVSNLRFHKIWQLLKQLEVSGYEGLCQKTKLLYNKFHRQYSRYYESTEVSVAGNIEVLPPAGPVQMVSQMAGLAVFQEILR